MKMRFIALLLCIILLLAGCGNNKQAPQRSEKPEKPGESTNLGDDNTSFGEDIKDSGAYDGYFEEESKDIVIECISGTKNAYKLEGTTLTFTAIAEESVYSISGTFRGNIVIDVGDSYKFDLELHGFSLVCDSTNPIMVKSGDEVTIKAKKDTQNYIYDKREAIDSTDETLNSGAIHSDVDLEISGKGELTVISENNNGIHSKDDLQVKNLTLYVACVDNALKGNDGVEIEGGNTTLIASCGDSIKTTNSGVSEKGNQKGNVSIVGGTHNLYAACDGIDAAHNVNIDDSTTVLNIYTDKYSNYSKEVTANSKDTYYIRYTSKNYKYSIKFINSESGDFEWVNAEYHSQVRAGRSTYYYYSFTKLQGYDKLQFFVYSSSMQQQQSEIYSAVSDEMTINTSYDTIALSGNSYSWTNYTTSIQGGAPGGPGGPGGMGDGNSEKGDHSTKGIKAANEIVILAGTISIKSYDDAIHAGDDTTLENGAKPLGNVTVNGGNITVYSNDDGLHADGTLSIKAGTVSVTNAYEGLEGATVNISGGYVSVYSKDDGINATATSGTGIAISGGVVYIYCTGDGIDSNSRTSYSGIVFSGGKTVVISNSGMNSALDTESGYSYTAGSVVAIMPRTGMTSESTHCQNFSSVGKSSQLSLTKDNYLVATIGEGTATIKVPVTLSAFVIVLGDNSPSITTNSSVSVTLDQNGVAWN